MRDESWGESETHLRVEVHCRAKGTTVGNRCRAVDAERVRERRELGRLHEGLGWLHERQLKHLPARRTVTGPPCRASDAQPGARHQGRADAEG